MAEEKKFVLYEYLVFFWKKKVFFLIIPLLFTLLGFGASYVIPTKGDYVGSARISTGGTNMKGMTDPLYVVDKFGKDVNGKIDAFVSSDSYIEIKIFNDDKEELEKDLHKMTSDIERVLVDNYDLRYATTEDQINDLKKTIEAQLEVLDVISNENLTVTDTENLARVLEVTQAEMLNNEAKMQRMQGDLTFFEKPGVTELEVKAVDKHQVELSLAGLVLGLFATFLILMLWKYVNEARRYSSHD